MHSPIPIYEQLIKGIRKMIEEKKLSFGESLPSIRQLSKQLGVAHNTVARAYMDLERYGYIQSYGSKGTFIKFKASEFSKSAQIILDETLEELIGMGFSKIQILSAVEQFFNTKKL